MLSKVQEKLICQSEQRIRVLARRMLAGFPAVRRWEETDDVVQEAAIRLQKAVQQASPTSELHLHRLFALQLRWVLIDFARRHAASSSFAANHQTNHGGKCAHINNAVNTYGEDEPTSLDDWTHFHEHADRLPEHLRDVFDLRWYNGLSTKQSADMLGVDVRTVSRHWCEVRILFGEKMGDASLL